MIFRILFIFLSLATVVYSWEVQCISSREHKEIIKLAQENIGSGKCWKIKVPEEKYIRLVLQKFDVTEMTVHIRVTVIGDNKEYFLGQNDVNKHFTELSDVTIVIWSVIPQHSWKTPKYSLDLSYAIEDIVCARNNSFRCSEYSCVPSSKTCDGIADCEGGEDEDGCDTGITSMDGVNNSRLTTISWLKNERTVSSIWRKNGHRAITALYLADGVDTKGSCDENEMFAKEMQLKTSLILLRNGTDAVSRNDLAMFIHALLVTCQNPRRFYGFDLVQNLKDKVKYSINRTHPIVSLALCNANETLPPKQVSKLEQILKNDSSHSILLDVQAMALMALSCVRNSGNHSNLTEIINSTITRFRTIQKTDGSFGNIYTTALVTQALLGSAEEKVPQPRMKDAVNYLLKQQTGDKSFGDFLATYLVLPILNSKSLVDIAHLNCQPKKPRDDPLSEIESRLGPKMYTEYSLYIGDDLDVVHSISLRVTQNLTAFEIMKVAAVADPKFKFESHKEGKHMYVFSIAEITNDPEAGKFWQLYLEQNQNNGTAELVTESPDQKVIHEHDRMIMWYKIADV